MPDIFTQEDAGRDRRMGEDPNSEIQNVVTQTLSSKEAKPKKPSKSKHLFITKHLRVGTKRMHIFSAFCEMPNGVTFETQEEGEIILLLLRKSFITNIAWVVFTILLALIPVGIAQFINIENTPLTLLSPQYMFVLLALYYLVILSYAFISFITWHFNTALVTSERIVDIDFSDLVYKNIAETKMDLVQDVSYTETGVIRTIFNYGDVLIQTAGTVDNFDLIAVPHPDRAVEIIEGLIGKAKGNVGV